MNFHLLKNIDKNCLFPLWALKVNLSLLEIGCHVFQGAERKRRFGA